MTVLFETLDIRGRKVVCTHAQWRDHILKKRPFMAGWENMVKQAVEHPSLPIYRDRLHENREVYYWRLKDKPRYLRVVVDFSDPDKGIVITAHPADSGKPGEKQIWPE